jgi:tetratricopeptide (TPR) repeat protein
MTESWKHIRLRAGLILLVTFVTYMPALRNGFIWDDPQNLTDNHLLQSIEGLRKIWLDPAASYQYYPLTYTTFWIESHLWGLQPFGYHAVNVLLHALNAVLLGILLARLSVPGAWLAALIFAVHPVEVQSVAWISERKNVLSVFFYLSALLAYLRFVERRHRAWRSYGLALLLFGLAMLSKSHAVSLPFVILALLWWKQERVCKRDVLALTPFVVIGIALALLTATREVLFSLAEGPEWVLSPLERLLVAGRVLWFYPGKLLWPHPLMMIYPRWQIDPVELWQYLFPLAAIAAVLALWVLRKRLGKGPLAAVLIFVGILAPTPALIKIAFMNQSYVADQWLYLPGMALIGLAAAGVVAFGRSLHRRQQLVSGSVAGMVVIVLGALSWQHCLVFRDQETLFRDNLLHNPLAWAAHNNLGNVLLQTGKTGEAIAQYQEALRIKPDIPDAHWNLGNALLQAGNLNEAIGQYEQALRIRPDNPDAQNHFGSVLMVAGKNQEAIDHYEQALRVAPDFPEAHYNLGLALAQTGRFQEAITHFQEALRLRPNYPEAQAALEKAAAVER